MPASSSAGLSMGSATIPPEAHSAGLSDVPAPMKDKGKGHALPGPYINEVPADILSFEENPYRYSLSYNNDEFNNSNYNAKDMQAAVSETTKLIHTILSGTASNRNSGSFKGEERVCVILCSKAMAKFRFTYDAMDTAYHEGNHWKYDLLASICNVVPMAHKSGENKLQLSIVNVW